MNEVRLHGTTRSGNEKTDTAEAAALNYLTTGNASGLLVKRSNIQASRRLFIEIIERFSEAIRNYSLRTHNRTLLKEVSFSSTYLQRLRHVDLIIKGRMILYFARLHIWGLHFYFISDEDLRDYENRLRNFSTALNNKQSSLNSVFNRE